MRALGLATFLALAACLCALPRHVSQDLPKRAEFSDLEFSGNGAGNEPVRGSVRVVKVSPHFLRHSPGLLGKPALKRGPFPAFLELGRPGPSVHAHAPAASLPHLSASYTGADARKRQGLEMWQRVMQKSEPSKEVLSLPFNSRDAGTQSCAALPFTQRITEEGCEPITVQNKLCFGQCNSMFVPPNGGSGMHRGGPPCSRCGPSRARTVHVPMHCGSQVREKRVMLVEECKCETGREEEKSDNMPMHL
ncbi:DAN domain family member 5 [Ictalurus furcatus]|uniref:DAN domain family member 5 n=1 Tax=Ictalurus furcatus TaxID=66913 RepID=UPI00235104EE|nr:DAN domain family member 5 [Ictalurus furcatus]